VVRVSSPVIPHGSPDLFRKRTDRSQEFFDGRGAKVSVRLDGRVKFIHIRLMVLPVVETHRRRVDVRLERIKVVGKRRERVEHVTSI